eukprot:TRINITY_DN8227_c0_g1_i7.p1 TRINITY_DN8227_c0_g1~~TRINITY_DN8227_c0_g1_i7.p1  ORF type:complete len:2534 (-),score=394.20 TRINITY_DN8227_c0_g1_i7:290-7891(-)
MTCETPNTVEFVFDKFIGQGFLDGYPLLELNPRTGVLTMQPSVSLSRLLISRLAKNVSFVKPFLTLKCAVAAVYSSYEAAYLGVVEQAKSEPDTLTYDFNIRLEEDTCWVLRSSCDGFVCPGPVYTRKPSRAFPNLCQSQVCSDVNDLYTCCEFNVVDGQFQGASADQGNASSAVKASAAASELVNCSVDPACAVAEGPESGMYYVRVPQCYDTTACLTVQFEDSWETSGHYCPAGNDTAHGLLYQKTGALPQDTRYLVKYLPGMDFIPKDSQCIPNETDYIIREYSAKDSFGSNGVTLVGPVLKCLEEKKLFAALGLLSQTVSKDYPQVLVSAGNCSAPGNNTLSAPTSGTVLPDTVQFDDPNTDTPLDYWLHPCDCFNAAWGNYPPVSPSSFQAVQVLNDAGMYNVNIPSTQELSIGEFTCGKEHLLDVAVYSGSSGYDVCLPQCQSMDKCKFFNVITLSQVPTCLFYSECTKTMVTPGSSGTVYWVPQREFCRIADPLSCWTVTLRRLYLRAPMATSPEQTAGFDAGVMEVAVIGDFMQILGTATSPRNVEVPAYRLPGSHDWKQKKRVPPIFHSGSQLVASCWAEQYGAMGKAPNVTYTCVDGTWQARGRDLDCRQCVQVAGPSYDAFYVAQNVQELYYASHMPVVIWIMGYCLSYDAEINALVSLKSGCSEWVFDSQYLAGAGTRRIRLFSDGNLQDVCLTQFKLGSETTSTTTTNVAALFSTLSPTVAAKAFYGVEPDSCNNTMRAQEIAFDSLPLLMWNSWRASSAGKTGARESLSTYSDYGFPQVDWVSSMSVGPGYIDLGLMPSAEECFHACASSEARISSGYTACAYQCNGCYIAAELSPRDAASMESCFQYGTKLPNVTQDAIATPSLVAMGCPSSNSAIAGVSMDGTVTCRPVSMVSGEAYRDFVGDTWSPATTTTTAAPPTGLNPLPPPGYWCPYGPEQCGVCQCQNVSNYSIGEAKVVLNGSQKVRIKDLELKVKEGTSGLTQTEKRTDALYQFEGEFRAMNSCPAGGLCCSVSPTGGDTGVQPCYTKCPEGMWSDGGWDAVSPTGCYSTTTTTTRAVYWLDFSNEAVMPVSSKTAAFVKLPSGQCLEVSGDSSSNTLIAATCASTSESANNQLFYFDTSLPAHAEWIKSGLEGKVNLNATQKATLEELKAGGVVFKGIPLRARDALPFKSALLGDDYCLSMNSISYGSGGQGSNCPYPGTLSFSACIQPTRSAQDQHSPNLAYESQLWYMASDEVNEEWAGGMFPNSPGRALSLAQASENYFSNEPTSTTEGETQGGTCVCPNGQAYYVSMGQSGVGGCRSNCGGGTIEACVYSGTYDAPAAPVCTGGGTSSSVTCASQCDNGRFEGEDTGNRGEFGYGSLNNCKNPRWTCLPQNGYWYAVQCAGPGKMRCAASASLNYRISTCCLSEALLCEAFASESECEAQSRTWTSFTPTLNCNNSFPVAKAVNDETGNPYDLCRLMPGGCQGPPKVDVPEFEPSQVMCLSKDVSGALYTTPPLSLCLDAASVYFYPAKFASDGSSSPIVPAAMAWTLMTFANNAPLCPAGRILKAIEEVQGGSVWRILCPIANGLGKYYSKHLTLGAEAFSNPDPASLVQNCDGDDLLRGLTVTLTLNSIRVTLMCAEVSGLTMRIDFSKGSVFPPFAEHSNSTAKGVYCPTSSDRDRPIYGEVRPFGSSNVEKKLSFSSIVAADDVRLGHLVSAPLQYQATSGLWCFGNRSSQHCLSTSSSSGETAESVSGRSRPTGLGSVDIKRGHRLLSIAAYMDFTGQYPVSPAIHTKSQHSPQRTVSPKDVKKVIATGQKVLKATAKALLKMPTDLETDFDPIWPGTDTGDEKTTIAKYCTKFEKAPEGPCAWDQVSWEALAEGHEQSEKLAHGQEEYDMAVETVDANLGLYNEVVKKYVCNKEQNVWEGTAMPTDVFQEVAVVPLTGEGTAVGTTFEQAVTGDSKDLVQNCVNRYNKGFAEKFTFLKEEKIDNDEVLSNLEYYTPNSAGFLSNQRLWCDIFCGNEITVAGENAIQLSLQKSMQDTEKNMATLAEWNQEGTVGMGSLLFEQADVNLAVESALLEEVLRQNNGGKEATLAQMRESVGRMHQEMTDVAQKGFSTMADRAAVTGALRRFEATRLAQGLPQARALNTTQALALVSATRQLHATLHHASHGQSRATEEEKQEQRRAKVLKERIGQLSALRQKEVRKIGIYKRSLKAMDRARKSVWSRWEAQNSVATLQLQLEDAAAEKFLVELDRTYWQIRAAMEDSVATELDLHQSEAQSLEAIDDYLSCKTITKDLHAAYQKGESVRAESYKALQISWNKIQSLSGFLVSMLEDGHVLERFAAYDAEGIDMEAVHKALNALPGKSSCALDRQGASGKLQMFLATAQNSGLVGQTVTQTKTVLSLMESLRRRAQAKPGLIMPDDQVLMEVDSRFKAILQAFHASQDNIVQRFQHVVRTKSSSCGEAAHSRPELMQGQLSAEEIRHEAEEDAERIREEARTEARKIVADARDMSAAEIKQAVALAREVRGGGK